MKSLFDREVWEEIFSMMNKSRWRTFLTAFSVSWGIFMLVILLGASTGLKNSITASFESWNKNGVWIWPGMTSIPYKGFQPGMPVQLQNSDLDMIANAGNIQDVSAMMQLSEDGVKVSSGNKASLAEVRAVDNNYNLLELIKNVEGRFFNARDMKEHRHVVVLTPGIGKELFKSGEHAVGKVVEIDGGTYKVIGIVEQEQEPEELPYVYIPLTTGQREFSKGNEIHTISFSCGHSDQDALLQKIKGSMAKRKGFDINDEKAINVFEVFKTVRMVNGIFRGLETFIWLIGGMTLLSGIVGVSNIMIVGIKERTREIGVRKAIGAPPSGIVILILQESLLITASAGFLGLLTGYILLHFLSANFSNEYFKNPGLDISIGITATLILVLAGGAAGVFPAIKASKIKPVEALKYE